MRLPLLGLLSFALLSTPCLATNYPGPVVSVLDGDTLEVLHNQRPERIRLHGIDCPEKGQAYGNKAKQVTAALVFGKKVTLQTHGKDKYGRTIADVLLPEGTNVNHELVRDGWCWWYRKYAPLDKELAELEQAAREARIGLWGDPAPVPPWVYRKARRGDALDLSDLVPLEEDTTEGTGTRTPPKLGLAHSKPPAEASSSPYPIIGNRKSHIYHRLDCPNYSQVAPGNRVAFDNTAEAEEAGYRMAKNCP